MTFRILVVTAAAATAAALVPGCGVDPSRVALPGSGVSGSTYPIHIQFTSALNLPLGAKVVANGARIGKLEQIAVVDPAPDRPGFAVADVAIQESITLPAATKAQLRQDTILGDIYISLDTTAKGPQGTLGRDAVIPIDQTEPALQIEDIISGLATFVSGGALRSAQGIVDQLNATLPPDPAETARIAAVLKANLIDVAGNLNDVDAFVDSIETNTQTIRANRDALGELLTEQGARDITAIAQSLIHTVGIIGALGGLAHALEWLAPLISSGNAAAKAFVPLILDSQRPLNLDAPSNLNKLVALLRDKVIPFFERGPKVAVDRVAVKGSVPTDEQVDQMIATLRMIGMVR